MDREDGIAKWSQIRVKFAFSGWMENIDDFWIVENTLSRALANKWVAVPNANELGLVTTCVSQRDVRVCALYDAKGSIAGIQCAIPPADVQNVPYNFNDFPVYEMKTINGAQYWTSTFYINNPATAKAGGRDVVTNLGDGLWFKNGSGYVKVPTDEATIAIKTLYTKQNCLPNMGTHYYYDTKPSTQCKDLQPFFLMTKNGNINGIGWQFFGKTKAVDRNWYDSIDRRATETTVPNGPKCMADWTDTYGVISIHFYFTEEPWKIECNHDIESVEPMSIFMKGTLFALYKAADMLAFLKIMGYNILHGLKFV